MFARQDLPSVYQEFKCSPLFVAALSDALPKFSLDVIGVVAQYGKNVV
jgi:hypothetical protein